MSERKRLTFTAIAVALVGIVTGLLLGGGLLPSQAAYQIYDERVTTTTTETVLGHSHGDIPQHRHTLTTEITTTETTPHGYFHGLATATASGTTASGTTASGTTASGTVEVPIVNQGFKPQALTVPVGTTITWVNLDLEDDHTVTSDTLPFDESLSFGNTFSYTFTEPGIYPYYCVPHDDMFGRIIVE